MSQLSWYLLALDWVEKVNVLFGTLAIIFSCISTFGLVGFLVLWLSSEIQETDTNVFQRLKKLVCICLPLAVLCWIPPILIPSKDTLKLIAANELILQNEQVQEIGNEVFDVVKQWLKELKPKEEGK